MSILNCAILFIRSSVARVSASALCAAPFQLTSASIQALASEIVPYWFVAPYISSVGHYLINTDFALKRLSKEAFSIDLLTVLVSKNIPCFSLLFKADSFPILDGR